MAEEESNTVEQPKYKYDANLAYKIETSWQDKWEQSGLYYAGNPVGKLADTKQASKPKKYILDMFPYPSGAGLHVGHPLGYIATDVYARYHRMQGYNVLHALGYDSFGLPAEQHAIATGVHPRINTEENISNMRRQLKRLGLGHDSRRSVSTTDEAFYKWTQWIFLKIFNSWYDEDQNKARPINELISEFNSGDRSLDDGQVWSELSDEEQMDVVNSFRLAYLDDSPVNWCPGLGTILSNEEVTAEGRSDIGNYPVFKRNMKQWMMRITKYADRLLDDLEYLDWPEPIKVMQRNWIGRSVGANVIFETSKGDLEVFTTRQDTLFGATFMVISPEHPMVETLTVKDNSEEVNNYCKQATEKTEKDRQNVDKEKTGVFTGSYATNPVNGNQIPIWVADYVLMGYGTGAIMAVPCGDERDFEFAKKYDLDIVAIQQPDDQWFESQGIEPTLNCEKWNHPYIGDSAYISSSNDSLDLNGTQNISEAKEKMNEWLEANNCGSATISYRLRDWLFSRQRYWGEPFPIVYDDNGYPHGLPEDQLPLKLPELEDFKPTALDPEDDVSEPQPPLSRAHDWLKVDLDLGEGKASYTREINVMPQWAGSCWYELRYLDPENNEEFVAPENEKYWMGPTDTAVCGGTDLYVGGVEHAVLHLLYARFWHKILFDLGYLSSFEPFHRLFNQGYIQAYAYRDDRGQPVEAIKVKELEDGTFEYEGKTVYQEYGKMGKSLKNIVTPDDMYDAYGADTFRLYEMSMGPLDASRPWNNRDVVGMQRFLQRIWRLVIDENSGEVCVSSSEADSETMSLLNKTISFVREEMDNLRFNTAISKLIELNNYLTSKFSANTDQQIPVEVAKNLLIMLAPFAPHICEELWSKLGNSDSVHTQMFPEANEALIQTEKLVMIVQVNGKVRDRIEVDADISQEMAEKLALGSEVILSKLDGDPKKIINRAPNLINIVV